eukprot:jgi/Bigna1/140617/aug1.57_g15325
MKYDSWFKAQDFLGFLFIGAFSQKMLTQIVIMHEISLLKNYFNLKESISFLVVGKKREAVDRSPLPPKEKNKGAGAKGVNFPRPRTNQKEKTITEDCRRSEVLSNSNQEKETKQLPQQELRQRLRRREAARESGWEGVNSKEKDKKIDSSSDRRKKRPRMNPESIPWPSDDPGDEEEEEEESYDVSMEAIESTYNRTGGDS